MSTLILMKSILILNYFGTLEAVVTFDMDQKEGIILYPKGPKETGGKDEIEK